MRVPDLDWPANLYTDVIVVPEVSVPQPAIAVERPDLWSNMASLWFAAGECIVGRTGFSSGAGPCA